jgi:hypothetical protein
VVREPPRENHDALTPDVDERLLLVFYEDDPHFLYHARILWICVSGSRWVVSTPTRDTFEEDFGGEHILPMTRASPYPLGVRPIFGFGLITPESYRDMRDQVLALAQILGAAVPLEPVGLAGAVWVFSDPCSEQFGSEVDVSLAANMARTRVGGLVGIVEADTPAGRQWTTMERVRRSDIEVWRGEKSTGSGRHPLLLPITLDLLDPPLFRETTILSKPTRKLPECYSGPSARKELAAAISASGAEPPAYAAAFITATGVAPRSSVAMEFVMQMHTFWILGSLDGIDRANCATAEHVARRILQLQRATRKNPRSPDFGGLDFYTQHVSMTTAGAATPEFDKHVASVQHAEAMIMKSQRLSQDEWDAAGKEKDSKKNRGENKKDKKDDEE